MNDKISESFLLLQDLGRHLRGQKTYNEEVQTLVDRYFHLAELLFQVFDNPIFVEIYEDSIHEAASSVSSGALRNEPAPAPASATRSPLSDVARSAEMRLKRAGGAISVNYETSEVTAGDIWKEARKTFRALMKLEQLPEQQRRRISQSTDFWDIRQQVRVSDPAKETLEVLAKRVLHKEIERQLPDVLQAAVSHVRGSTWAWERRSSIIGFFMILVTVVCVISVVILSNEVEALRVSLANAQESLVGTREHTEQIERSLDEAQGVIKASRDKLDGLEATLGELDAELVTFASDAENKDYDARVQATEVALGSLAKSIGLDGYKSPQAEYDDAVASLFENKYATQAELTRYAKKKEFEAYAKKDELEAYAKQKELESYAKKNELGSYAKKRELESYAKKDELESYAKKKELEAYAKKKELESYAKKDELGPYAKKDELGPYAKKKELEGYAKKDELGAYAKSQSLDGYAKKKELEGYAKKDELDGYAKKKDLEAYVKKGE